MTATLCCESKLPTSVKGHLFKIDCALNPHHAGRHESAHGVFWTQQNVDEAQRQMVINRHRAATTAPERARKRRLL
ncbi:hypothetical protein [uncultured Gordonia sp.]|uniref:hypothetical protein n=1 Tax=uncultured Gordonia sp. TaxID=198437 RepID=UPI002586D411|nr:hypothetical protein [uncultured Gordonia sp.]